MELIRREGWQKHCFLWNSQFRTFTIKCHGAARIGPLIKQILTLTGCRISFTHIQHLCEGTSESLAYRQYDFHSESHRVKWQSFTLTLSAIIKTELSPHHVLMHVVGSESTVIKAFLTLLLIMSLIFTREHTVSQMQYWPFSTLKLAAQMHKLHMQNALFPAHIHIVYSWSRPKTNSNVHINKLMSKNRQHAKTREYIIFYLFIYYIYYIHIYFCEISFCGVDNQNRLNSKQFLSKS